MNENESDEKIGIVKGDYSMAWIEGNKCFFEFDTGRFGTKFTTVHITLEEYHALKEGKLTHEELSLRCLNR